MRAARWRRRAPDGMDEDVEAAPGLADGVGHGGAALGGADVRHHEQVFRGRVIGPGASIVSTVTPALRSCAAKPPLSGSTVSAHFLFTSIFHAVMAARPSNVRPSSTTVASTASMWRGPRSGSPPRCTRAGRLPGIPGALHGIPTTKTPSMRPSFRTEAGERPPEGARLSPKCWGRPRRHGRPR